MKSKIINKIAIIISWPREIDMYNNLIKKLPKSKVVLISNDIKSIEKGRNEVNKIIIKQLVKYKLPHKKFSEVYKKKKYKIVISTGELNGEKISFYSLLRFCYAFTLGAIIEKTSLYRVFEKLFKKPLTGNGFNCKLGAPWYPEKSLGNIIIKYPDGADIKKKNYPYNFLRKVFDIFLSYSDVETNLIKKKFKDKVCYKIDYFRYKNISNSKKLNIKSFLNYQKFDNKKKVLFWIPTHVDNSNELNLNITLWMHKIILLKKYFNIIIRPHPKSILSDESLVEKLIKFGFIIDNNSNRKIGEIINHSSVVLCDYGGALFSTIFLKKPVVLLNLPTNFYFRKKLESINSIDTKIRKNLTSFNTSTSQNIIENKILFCLKKKNTKKLNKLKIKCFGKTKPYNLNKFIKILLNLLYKN